MKSSEILHLVDEYINKYKSEQTNKYETIYRVPASDASKMGPEFIRDDKERVFFCFYRLPPEQYDDGQAQEFAAGHYKFDFSFLNFVKRNKSNKKYTITQRTRAYDRTRPTGGTNDIYEKMRWVAYYRNRISLFDKKVENLLEKYSPMKYRSGRNKIISNEKIKNTVRERQLISK